VFKQSTKLDSVMAFAHCW